MRFEAYDAKSNPAGVTQYQQKCQELANSYLEKRRSLLNPSMEMKETLYKIYKKEPLNSPISMTPSVFGQQQQQTANIFGSSPSTNQQSKSLFGGSSLNTGTSSGSSIFGGKSSFGASSNLFGTQPTSTSAFTPSSSIFGGASQSQQKPGIFGASSSSSGSSLCGQPNTQSTASGLIQPSLFSSSTAPQQNQGTTSIFGSPATPSSTTASTGGIFGGATNTSSAGLFGQPAQFSSPVQATTGGLFGQPAQQAMSSASLFGQAPTPTTQQSNIFGSPAQSSFSTSMAAAAPTNLFGQPMQPTVSSSTSTTSQSIFGQPSAFGQSASSSIFGAPAITTKTTQSSNLFSQPITTSMSSISNPSQDQSVSSPFDSKVVESPMSSVFGQVGGAAKSDSTTGLFGKTIEKQKDSSVYTPMSELTQEEIDIYRTCHFELGKMPENPPPLELC